MVKGDHGIGEQCVPRVKDARCPTTLDGIEAWFWTHVSAKEPVDASRREKDRKRTLEDGGQNVKN